MHQVWSPFARLFFLTQSTSCSDIRCRYGVTVVYICRAYLYVRPSICSWSLTLYKYKRRTAKPSSLGTKKPRFRFSTVLTKTAVFGFGSVTVTALQIFHLHHRRSQTSCNGSECCGTSDHRNSAWSFTAVAWWSALADDSTAGGVQACHDCSLVSSVPSSKVPRRLLHASLRSFQPPTCPFGQPS